MHSPRPSSPVHPVLTVTQLTAQLRDVLEEVFQNVYVTGEVSNAKIYPSGHWYFSLKDKDSTLPCVCFRAANSALKFKIEDGLTVVARGRMNVYPPKGAYQMVVASLEPVGVGDWQLAFDQLKSKLEREGLLDAARKRPIPIMPRKIGVVTSPAGAAVRDVLSALSRRNRCVNVVIAPAKVQGDGSAEEVANAIDYLNRIEGVDVIIVARGGGSIEDLWSFNTEVVARAVLRSAIPIISGVGHETDLTICDLAADLRAPTPTAAAELVARGSAELIEKWNYLQKQLVVRTETHITRARTTLERLKPLHVLLRYNERLKRDSVRITLYKERLAQAINHNLARSHQRWWHKYEQLQALGPLNVLNRGFAIVRDQDGHVVRSSHEVKAGDLLTAMLNQGTITLRVESTEFLPAAPIEPETGSVSSLDPFPDPKEVKQLTLHEQLAESYKTHSADQSVAGDHDSTQGGAGVAPALADRRNEPTRDPPEGVVQDTVTPQEEN